MAVRTTPLVAQYLQVKERVPDAILFFRLGDFYEMFFEDAQVASQVLDLQLTSRSRDGVPLCGVPHHAAQPYVAKLLRAGHKVAICEQETTGSSGRGLIPRQIVRVITPGTVDEELLLVAGERNFLAAIDSRPEGFGLVAIEVSTGEFLLAQLATPRELADELARLRPAEILLPSDADDRLREMVASRRTLVTALDRESFDPEVGRRALSARFGNSPLGRSEELLLGPVGAVLEYIERTFGGQFAHLQPPQRYEPLAAMAIDERTSEHLELTVSSDGEKRGSLLGLLDETCTPMGARILRGWIERPLTDVAAIEARLDAVEELIGRGIGDAGEKALRQVGDLERLVGRIGSLRATPRDLLRLAQALEALEALRSTCFGFQSPLLRGLIDRFKPAPDAVEMIRSAISEDAPLNYREGNFIRSGYHPRIAELRELARNAHAILAAIETRERERTGIASLKVRYNQVFGYYIEVSKANLDRVPPDYERKQTLVGAERFVTPELKDLERRILAAESGLKALELELFAELKRKLVPRTGEFQLSARAVGEFDALAALAKVAQRRGYSRPRINTSTRLVIRDGRHPVLEAMLRQGEFVPNDLELDPERRQLLLVTGPNMAGKSTYLRQAALIVVMAQIGSFVPASEAEIGIVDRISTRIGARDNLRGGESTFMVEMRETALLVEGITDRSLLILDEVGRGTSTYDGVAIAWALAEHLHNRTRAKVLFATHYHELTALARSLPRVKNLNALVREWNGEIVFLKRIAEGAASRSYGVEVARLAGLPEPVVERARQVLGVLEEGELEGRDIGSRMAERTGAAAPVQRSLFAPRSERIVEELRSVKVDQITPLEALNVLARLVAEAQAYGDGRS